MAPGASAVPIPFGDVQRAYIVRQVPATRTVRFRERHTDAPRIGFMGHMRLGAHTDDPWR